MISQRHVGVILMTYGSPATLDDIPTYIKHVYGGREPGEEVIREFRRRYALIGGSPLLRITREQAAALQEELNAQHPDGPTFSVTDALLFPRGAAFARRIEKTKAPVRIIPSPTHVTNKRVFFISFSPVHG